jgi:hypothetical protein
VLLDQCGHMPMMAKPGEVAGALAAFAAPGPAPLLAATPSWAVAMPEHVAATASVAQPVAVAQPRPRIFLTHPETL